jgi:hypothetical protein
MLNRYRVILFATLLVVTGYGEARAAIPALERAALIALHVATDGDDWWDSTGWQTPPLAGDGFALPGMECGWFGVVCDAGETTVLGISLPANLLSGTIPPELGDLAGLEYLDLGFNLLSGSIPLQLGSASALSYVKLNGNALSGGIPASRRHSGA